MKDAVVLLFVTLLLLICITNNKSRIEDLEQFQKNATLELARLQHQIPKEEIEFIKSVKRAETNRGLGTLKGVKK